MKSLKTLDNSLISRKHIEIGYYSSFQNKHTFAINIHQKTEKLS